jgi:hypothetical protein
MEMSAGAKQRSRAGRGSQPQCGPGANPKSSNFLVASLRREGMMAPCFTTRTIGPLVESSTQRRT